MSRIVPLRLCFGKSDPLESVLFTKGLTDTRVCGRQTEAAPRRVETKPGPAEPWQVPNCWPTPPLTLYPVTSDSSSRALTCSQLRITFVSVAFQTTFPGGCLGAGRYSGTLTGTCARRVVPKQRCGRREPSRREHVSETRRTQQRRENSRAKPTQPLHPRFPGGHTVTSG